MTGLRYISMIAGVLCCMLSGSCDVHEFPNPVEKEYPFVLHLDYDTNMPLYKIVEYHDDTRSLENNYDIRYIVKVYPAGDSREELLHCEFFKDELETLENDVTIMLKEGEYKFVVWTDYVSSHDGVDLFYNTQNFEEIQLLGDEHYGCNDLRDAFNGTVEANVSETSLEATVEMGRPMAKFSFISDDLEDFMSNMVRLRSGKDEGCDTRAVELSDFKVVFHYYGFMPSSFNMFTNKPASAVSGVRFESDIKALNEKEADLGFDYVFVNGTESAVSIYLEIFDADGTLLSSFKPVKVPLIRSKLTVVKADFLTSKASGGVSIVPDFDGEYNFPVY